jgi:hypothetical protein
MMKTMTFKQHFGVFQHLRFHFKDVTGNEFAVWTEVNDDL